MSLKVAARVWEHSRHRGTTKLLLLALADFANDDGICWPGAAKLSARINENERYTRLLIKQLTMSGDIIAIVGGGRGNMTTYGIAIGLNTKQLAHLNSDLQNTVMDNTDHHKTVISGDENSVLQLQKQCTTVSNDNGRYDAPESLKLAQKSTDNRNRTVIDPESQREREDRDGTARSLAQDHPAVAIYQEAFPSIQLNGKQEAIIRNLVGDGVERLECWRATVQDYELSPNWKPENVGNMRNRFEHKLHERTGSASNGKHLRSGAGHHSERGVIREADPDKPF